MQKYTFKFLSLHVESREYGRGDPLCWPRDTPQFAKLGTNFAYKCRSLGRSVGVVRSRAKAKDLVSLIFVFQFRASGAPGSIVVEALRCKPEGRVFETWWGEWIFFNLPNSSSRTRRWGLLSL
jgi:hypothetical protein